MPRPQPQPNKLHDELDALLDGRPVELTVELAPLVEAADGLRAELAAFELDPEVAARHLERVLEGSGTVVRMPLRPQPNSWDVRRRIAAVVLAAALVLAPATMASAAALPGQPMYPFKLAIEQLRLASVQWSPEREAAERTRVADTRLDELKKLVELDRFTQIPTAIDALTKAVAAAQNAVAEAEQAGAARSDLAALTGQLGALTNNAARAVVTVSQSLQAAPLPGLSDSTRRAIEAEVRESETVLPSPAETGTRDTDSVGPGSSSTVPEPQGQEPSDPPPSSPPPSDPEPSDPPPSSATPTTEGPTTTAPTTPSSDPDPPTTPDPGSPSGPGLDDAAGGRTQHGSEAPPTTTGP